MTEQINTAAVRQLALDMVNLAKGFTPTEFLIASAIACGTTIKCSWAKEHRLEVIDKYNSHVRCFVYTEDKTS